MTGMFDLRVVATSDEAREMVADHEIVGAFVLPSAENPTATVLTNQAGGSAAQQVVNQVFTHVAEAQRLPIVPEDAAPLPSSDSGGTVSMYVATGWVLSGFMIIVVSANAAPASRPLRTLLPIVAVYAPLVAALIWLIGLFAVFPVVGVLMFLGVPATNGALSIYMGPEIFRILHD
ncbi:hypothetical protein G6030_00630 [Dietzia sp. E1]|uniref:hypothetical protein n=1 Tax=Dietzia sp. E1 TaxID=328361 RepID=UPI0015F79349|nr:hypothetical protein [Dietzia sp. E1]MBB1019825.1 hypothetical protein [Dietzia sp. E1]